MSSHMLPYVRSRILLSRPTYVISSADIVSSEVKLLFDVVAGGSLPVSPSLFRYGNDVVQRNGTSTQGSRKTWIDINRLLVPGYLSRYHLYANAADRPGSADDLPSPSMTRIQIWRPAQTSGRPRYTLVWERRVLLNTTHHGMLYTVSLRRSLTLLVRMNYT